MDQETREFLQEHFGRIDDRFERVDQQIVDLRSEIDQRFEKVDQRFETLEEETRLTRVLVEGVQSDLKAVAESFATVDAKVDRTAASLRDEMEEDRTRNTQLHRRHEHRITDMEHRIDLLEGSES